MKVFECIEVQFEMKIALYELRYILKINYVVESCMHSTLQS